MRSSASIPISRLDKFTDCLAYYYDHQKEMDRLVEEQLQEIGQLRHQSESVLRQTESKGACFLMVALYMDHHVPSAITAGLRMRGVDVVTAEEDGAASMEDDSLLDRATSLGRVLFSEDRDLLVIAQGWLQTGRDFSGVVYAHQLAISIGQAVHDLELLAKVLEPADMRNHVEYLPYS